MTIVNYCILQKDGKQTRDLFFGRKMSLKKNCSDNVSHAPIKKKKAVTFYCWIVEFDRAKLLPVAVMVLGNRDMRFNKSYSLP